MSDVSEGFNRDDGEFLLTIAKDAALLAGEYLRSMFGRSLRYAEKSGYFDLVTEYDERAEEMIREYILQRVPHSTIIGEESAPIGSGRVRWYIDPIDGTSNFASGFPFYCVSIGVAIDGVLKAGCVYAPEFDDMYASDGTFTTLNGVPISVADTAKTAESIVVVSFPYEGRSSEFDEREIFDQLCGQFRGVRRLGSAALGLAYVAAGRAVAASEIVAKPWDVAAGFLLVKSAGGVVHMGGHAAQNSGSVSWDQAPRYVAAGSNFSLEGSGFNLLFQDGHTDL